MGAGMKLLKRYIINNLLSLDQTIFTLIGGDPDDTFSSQAWKLYVNKNIHWPVTVIDFFFGEGHCERVVEWDEGKYSLWNYRG